MRFTHTQHIGIYENSISDEWCDTVLKYYNFKYESSYDRDHTDGALNGVRDRSLEIDDENLIKDFCYNFKSNIYPKYKYKYFYETPNEFTYSGFKVQRTLPSEGYHIWHSEKPPVYVAKEVDIMTRWGVYILYLNDVKEGGETEFLYQSLRVQPKKGTLCIFPAYFTHVHRGNPPLLGEKYILTGWLHLKIEENKPQ